MDRERESSTAVLSLGVLFGIAVNILAIYGLVVLLSG